MQDSVVSLSSSSSLVSAGHDAGDLRPVKLVHGNHVRRLKLPISTSLQALHDTIGKVCGLQDVREIKFKGADGSWRVVTSDEDVTKAFDSNKRHTQKGSRIVPVRFFVAGPSAAGTSTTSSSSSTLLLPHTKDGGQDKPLSSSPSSEQQPPSSPGGAGGVPRARQDQPALAVSALKQINLVQPSGHISPVTSPSLTPDSSANVSPMPTPDASPSSDEATAGPSPNAPVVAEPADALVPPVLLRQKSISALERISGQLQQLASQQMISSSCQTCSKLAQVLPELCAELKNTIGELKTAAADLRDATSSLHSATAMVDHSTQSSVSELRAVTQELKTLLPLSGRRQPYHDVLSVDSQIDLVVSPLMSDVSARSSRQISPRNLGSPTAVGMPQLAASAELGRSSHYISAPSSGRSLGSGHTDIEAVEAPADDTDVQADAAADAAPDAPADSAAGDPDKAGQDDVSQPDIALVQSVSSMSASGSSLDNGDFVDEKHVDSKDQLVLPKAEDTPGNPASPSQSRMSVASPTVSDSIVVLHGSATDNPEFQEKLSQLRELGYANESFNAVLLEQYNGDVQKVVASLDHYARL